MKDSGGAAIRTAFLVGLRLHGRWLEVGHVIGMWGHVRKGTVATAQSMLHLADARWMRPQWHNGSGVCLGLPITTHGFVLGCCIGYGVLAAQTGMEQQGPVFVLLQQYYTTTNSSLTRTTYTHLNTLSARGSLSCWWLAVRCLWTMMALRER